MDLQELQFKYIEDAIFPKILKSNHSFAFRKPVDPIELNIPDYFEKIKHPMDLSTIKANLKKRTYNNIEEVKADFDLMFQNCYTYNSAENPVHKSALQLEKLLSNYWNQIPSTFTEVKKKKKSEPIKEAPREIKEMRDSKEFDDHTKKRKVTVDLGICQNVMNELLKQKHAPFMWPFYDPVTEESAPGYTNVIKHPTDLKTIQKKIDENKFDSVDDFHKELKLMVNNCFKYNSETKKIYDNAIEVEKLFESLLCREKSERSDIIKKIGDMRNTISSMEKEINILEEVLSENEKVKKVIKEFTMEEKLEIGKGISELNQIQTTRIAQILCKGGVNVDFVSKNEVEVDLRILPDMILAEISDYLKNVANLKKNENFSYEKEEAALGA